MADPVFQALGLAEEPSPPKGPAAFAPLPVATLPPCSPGLGGDASQQLLQQLHAQSSALAWSHAAAAAGANFQAMNPAAAGAAAAAAWAAMAAAPWVHASAMQEGLARLNLNQQLGPESPFWPGHSSAAAARVAAQAAGPASSAHASSNASLTPNMPAFLRTEPPAAGDANATASTGGSRTLDARPCNADTADAAAPDAADDMLRDSCPELDLAIAGLLHDDEACDDDKEAGNGGQQWPCENSSSPILPQVPSTPPPHGKRDLVFGTPAKVSLPEKESLQPPPGLYSPHSSQSTASPVILNLSSMDFPQRSSSQESDLGESNFSPFTPLSCNANGGSYADAWNRALPPSPLPAGNTMSPHAQAKVDAEGSAAGAFLLSLLHNKEEALGNASVQAPPKRSTRRGRRAGRAGNKTALGDQ